MDLTGQTSAQIISEARASLKSVRISRPITPAPAQIRSLWGDSTEGTSNRPPSVMKMSRVPFAPSQKRPSSGVRLAPISTPRPPQTSHATHRSKSAGLIRKSHSLDQVDTPVELAESLSLLELYIDTPCLDWNVYRLKNTLAVVRSYQQNTASRTTEQVADKLITPLFKIIQTILSSSQTNSHLLLSVCSVAMLAYAGMCSLSRANLSNINTVCQLVFSLARDEINDVHFLDTECANAMLVLLQGANKDNIPEYLVYLLGALKLISSSPSCPSSVTERYLSLSILLANHVIHTLEQDRLSGACLLQIVWSLRNLCDTPIALVQLTTPEVVLLVADVLQLSERQEVVLYAAKFCSKLATNVHFQRSLTCEVSALPKLLSALSINSNSHRITSRLAFTLSMLVMDDVNASSRILSIPNSIETVLHTVDRYSETTNQQRMSCLPALTSLIGNLSLHPEAGGVLSSAPSLSFLLISSLDQLTQDPYKDTEFLTALLTAMNNLSFYQLDADSSQQLTHSLIHLLMVPSISLDTIQHVVSCLGNLTRTEECRTIVRSLKADLFLLTLLESTDANVLFATTGTLINLTSKPDSIPFLLDNGLVDSLVCIARLIGTSDTQVMCHTCQIIWNISDVLLTYSTSHEHIRLKCEQLVSVITESLNTATRSLSDEVQPFMQVGSKLLCKLNPILYDKSI